MICATIIGAADSVATKIVMRHIVARIDNAYGSIASILIAQHLRINEYIPKVWFHWASSEVGRPQHNQLAYAFLT